MNCRLLRRRWPEHTLRGVSGKKTGQTDDLLIRARVSRGQIICINCPLLNERRSSLRGEPGDRGHSGRSIVRTSHRSGRRCSSRKHVERGAHWSTHRWVERFCTSRVIRMLYGLCKYRERAACPATPRLIFPTDSSFDRKRDSACTTRCDGCRRRQERLKFVYKCHRSFLLSDTACSQAIPLMHAHVRILAEHTFKFN